MSKRTIIGYADKLSVQPGDDLAIKVSSAMPGSYEAQLVRVLAGDDSGPQGYCEELVDAHINGTHRARAQSVVPGSFAHAPWHAAAASTVEDLSDFTLSCAVYPTTPLKSAQLIFGWWNPETKRGLALGIADGGVLSCWWGDGQNVVALSLSRPAVPARWTHVIATYQAESNTLRLLEIPFESGAGSVYRSAPQSAEMAVDTVAMVVDQSDGISFAAAFDSHCPRMHFNGRLDSPRILDMVVGEEHYADLLSARAPPSLVHNVIGWWDFAQGIGTDNIHDTGPHGLDGEVVHCPARAVTGVHWNGDCHQWGQCPEHYSAIHFHDDDLIDAGWETDFTLEVPADLRSGIYAVRLRQGDPEQDDRIVFFVRPSRSGVKAKTAFLVPTASYLAYANYRMRLNENTVFGSKASTAPYDNFLREHPEFGASCYDKHSDWSGVHVSSRHRPLTTVRPRDNRIWGFPADLNILAWLEAAGFEYDIITDEDLHAEGAALLAPYRAVLTGSHPEYYSDEMLDGVDVYLRNGGRLMYLGGNGFYWRIAFHPTKPGVIEVRRAEDGTRAWIAEPGEYYHEFDGRYGGLWRRLGRSPNQTVGVGFAAQGFEASSYYRRNDASRNPRAAFIFEGIEDERIGDFGSLGGGAAGEEIDRYDVRLGSPRHALVVASSEAHDEYMLRTKEEFLTTVLPFQDPKIRADMVFFECPNGGAVFSTGSIAWAGALAHNHYDNNVAAVTANVLRRFIDARAFEEW